jgi:hypothetical protein
MLRREIYWHDDDKSLTSCVADEGKQTDSFFFAPASYSWAGPNFARFCARQRK